MSLWSRLGRRGGQGVDGAPAEGVSGERFICADFIRFPLSERSQLIYSRTNRVAQVLPSNSARLLDRCRSFKTMDEHAQDYSRFTSSGPAAAHRRSVESVKAELLDIAETGLLVSEGDFLKMCRSSSKDGGSGGDIGTLGVVTRDRVESLGRCLGSYIENSKKYGRANDFVVLDDSESAGVRNQTRRLLLSLKEKFSAEIYYAGLEEKRRFAEALISRGGLPPDVVKFALLGLEGFECSIGANRNSLALHTVGDLVLSVDDDTQCRVASHPGAAGELAMDSGNEFIDYWFFPDRAAALRSSPLTYPDILSIHERLLGKSIGDCIPDDLGAEAPNCERVGPRFMRGLPGGDAKVAVTFTGLIGDSGMPVPLVYLLLTGGSRERLVKSESDYATARSSRELVRVAKRLTLTDNVWCCQTTAFGFDNRGLLPPFLPVQRNQDSIFGVLMQECFNNYYFGHLPWAVLHAPAEPRAYPPNSIPDSARMIPTVGLLSACVSAFDLWPRDSGGEENLRALGRHLTEMGSMKLEDFEEAARRHVLRARCSQVSVLEHQLKSYRGQPSYWAADLERYIENLEHAVATTDNVVPSDLPGKWSGDEARRQSQRLVLMFGNLLRSWPDIVAASKEARAGGERLAGSV